MSKSDVHPQSGHSWIVHIRSKDCKEINDFNTNLIVDLRQAIKRIPNHKFHLSISSAEIPCMWYNVCEHLQSNMIIVNGNVSPANNLILPESFPLPIVYLNKDLNYLIKNMVHDCDYPSMDP